MTYPETRRADVVDERFGTAIPDPYRWLENDIRRDPDVALWVDAQNSVSAPYLAELPGLMLREGVDGPDRVVIDPNEWSEDGASALAEWAPSEDGTHVAFAVQESGADWRSIRVLDIESGTILDDEIAWARFTRIAWAKDGSGFFYARNPEPDREAAFEAPVLGHAVYFHRLGTPQAEDRLVHAPSSERPLLHSVEVTPDGRYAVIYSMPLTGGNALSLIDLTDPDWPVTPVVASFDHGWTLVGNVGTKLFLSTQEGAERGKVVTADLADPEPDFTDLVPEKEDAVLQRHREATRLAASR